jgi:hypothetical protein
VVKVTLAAPVPLHGIEPELERRDSLRSVRAPDGRVDGALDRERRGLDQLRPVIDRVERVQALDPTRIGDRDERVELPVILDRERDALLVGEAPHDVRRDRPAEMGVELREPDVGGEHGRELTSQSGICGADSGRSKIESPRGVGLAAVASVADRRERSTARSSLTRRVLVKGASWRG